MSLYQRVVFPLMSKLPPETAHGLAGVVLRRRLMPHRRAKADPRLTQTLFGIEFKNPVGIAAGFDKNAEFVDALIGLGFGFVEIGTVTPKPQDGNKRPRLFRLTEDRALINRMGFNNHGMADIGRRLAARRGRAGIVGANIGKNRTQKDAAADYESGARALGPYCDYLVINVSSPNTPGLRDLQEKSLLSDLIAKVAGALKDVTPIRQPPILLKIAPDLTEQGEVDIAALALEGTLAGLIVSNTTVNRPPGLQSPLAGEAGGLSGAPLAQIATEQVRRMYHRCYGRVPIIGVGGVFSADDAYAKIRAGASLVQLYTGFVFEGPGIARSIVKGLVARLQRDGFQSITEAIGADHRTSAPQVMA